MFNKGATGENDSTRGSIRDRGQRKQSNATTCKLKKNESQGPSDGITIFIVFVTFHESDIIAAMSNLTSMRGVFNLIYGKGTGD